jgi:hypothetical protein
MSRPSSFLRKRFVRTLTVLLPLALLTWSLLNFSQPAPGLHPEAAPGRSRPPALALPEPQSPPASIGSRREAITTAADISRTAAHTTPAAALDGIWQLQVDETPVSHWAPGTGSPAPQRSGRLLGDWQAMRSAAKGAAVTFPLFDGEVAHGVVRHTAEIEPGARIWSGRLTSPEGSFFIEHNALGWHGAINLAGRPDGYKILPGLENHPGPWLERRPRGELECSQAGGSDNPDSPNVDPAMVATDLQSRPGAARVIYLDFNGGTISGTYWNSEYNDDDPISYADSGMSRENRIRAWAHAAEDFQAFNVNVTTNVTAFSNASSTNRIRVAITPTKSWYPDAKGGVARVGSYGSSGTVVWVWNLGWLSAGETISHEAGHALGLHHSSYWYIPDNDWDEYYDGHGEGANGWAPIMGWGADEARYITTWDNGSYPWSTNSEDQKAILTVYLAGVVGDDHGDSTASATTLNPEGPGPSFRGTGILTTSSDVDYFRVQLPAGTWVFQVTGNPFGRNINFTTQIRGPGNNVLDETDNSNSTDAVSALQLAAGTHYFTVRSTTRPESDDDPGYPRYGQLGTYSVHILPFGFESTPPTVSFIELSDFELGSSRATLKVLYEDDTLIDSTSLHTGDVIMRRGGTSLSGTMHSVSGEGDARYVTFRFDAPGVDWDIGEGGSWEFISVQGAIRDNWGNTSASKVLTTRTLPATDPNPPQITLPNGLNNASSGETSYTFQIACSDIAPVTVQSYGTGCVEVRRVTAGETLFTSTLPTVPVVTSVSTSDYNKAWTINYSMAAPGGTWDDTDIGEYEIWLRSSKVRDANDNVAPAQKIGSFFLRKRLWQRTFDETGFVTVFTLGSSWSIGDPQGTGGYAHDPTAAASGSNVLGYRLGSGSSALYQHSLTTGRTATSPPINVTGYQSISLQFQRWLSVAAGDDVSIQISRDGSSWTTVWRNPEDTAIHDSYWRTQEIPLPGTIANNASALQFRFVMGPTDSANAGGGWNIDTIKIIAAGIYNPGRLIVNNIPSQVTEGATFNLISTVRLDQAPLTNVTVEINAGSQLDASRTTMTFTPTNYATPQNLLISAVDDQVVEGNGFAALSLRLSTTDPAFDGVSSFHLIRVIDDDSPMIAFQPQNKAVAPGQTATFGVAVYSSFSATALYQWYRGERGDTSDPISGATSASEDILLPAGSSQPVPVWVRVRTLLGKREDSETALLSPLKGYAAWKSRLLDHGYTAASLAAAGFDNADPDLDGLTHLLEYALGGQPYTQDQHLLPTVSLERSTNSTPVGPISLIPSAGSGGKLDLVLTFGPMKPDLRYIAEFSENMTTWTVWKEETAATLIGRAVPTETKVRIPTQDERRMLARLRVVRVPE